MSYAVMLYGAAISALLAALAVALLGASANRHALPVVITTLAAFFAPLAWNSILQTTGATSAFSHDLAFKPFPISWQDTGSGVFTLAAAFTVLSLGAGAGNAARQTARTAFIVALAALLVDIYLY
ncbi:MAG: hypothetical protein ACR2LA_05625 [Acidimicrobiales bacterium]